MEEGENAVEEDRRMVKDMSTYLLQLDKDRDTWTKGVRRGHYSGNVFTWKYSW